MPPKKQGGHRKRLRERFLEKGENLSDDEILELVLTFAIPRQDVEPLAVNLNKHFGGVNKVLSASVAELMKFKGLGEASAVLLKTVDFLRKTSETRHTPPQQYTMSNQSGLFDNIDVMRRDQDDTPKHNSIEDDPCETEDTPHQELESKEQYGKNEKMTSFKITRPNSNTRKFQVSNGYNLEFDQLARVLYSMLDHKEAKRISRKTLQDETGLAGQHVKSIVSIGAAMGLIVPVKQILSSAGLVIAEEDVFLEQKGTLQWCHYMASSTSRNLIWYEIFNNLLPKKAPLSYNDIIAALRKLLAGDYSDKSIKNNLLQEVYFVVDAYTQRNFKTLELLCRDVDDMLYLRRFSGFIPSVLCAMIYDFCDRQESRLLQIKELASAAGSPAIVFGLDEPTLRQQIENLHDRGWLSYETTHNLDQIRLKSDMEAGYFLSKHFYDDER